MFQYIKKKKTYVFQDIIMGLNYYEDASTIIIHKIGYAPTKMKALATIINTLAGRWTSTPLLLGSIGHNPGIIMKVVHIPSGYLTVRHGIDGP